MKTSRQDLFVYTFRGGRLVDGQDILATEFAFTSERLVGCWMALGGSETPVVRGGALVSRHPWAGAIFGLSKVPLVERLAPRREAC